ncbi:MAG: hypothetical protein LC785_11910 [Acidobacteria bacterium]|nr:hypothetical protein [Acidobacteriota bacterium]
MKTKILSLIALALALVVAGVIKTASKNPQSSETEVPPRRGQLQWYAQRAKVKGETRVELPAPIPEYNGSSGSTTIDKALELSGAVIAEPIREKVVSNDSQDEIGTWYKFKIVEVLSKPAIPACPNCRFLEPPADLLPLAEDEFLISKYGGTLIIDGVKVSMSDGEWPPFQRGKQYLILLSLYTSGVGEVMGGPRGVFAVNSDGTAEPVSGIPHPIKQGMKEKFGNLVGKLREHLKAHKAS